MFNDRITSGHLILVENFLKYCIRSEMPIFAKYLGDVIMRRNIIEKWPIIVLNSEVISYF